MAKATYKELEVWRNSVDLVVAVYQATDDFPKREMFGLSQQMRRAAVSIPSNIAEGYGRRTNRQRYSFLENSMGSLYELETQLEISHRLGFASRDVIQTLTSLLGSVGRPLTALMRYVETEARAEPTRRNYRNDDN
jgi:four helix bundle protein